MMEFESGEDFAKYLLFLHIAIADGITKGLKQVAKKIERDAKSQIGFYQPRTGHFQSWVELTDATEAEKARLGYEPDAPLLRDGKLRDSIEHEVYSLEAVIGSKSDIAAWQEFGTRTIPPRPFIGPAAYMNKKAIREILGMALVEGLVGGEPIHKSLRYDFNVK
jgi:phage gpG-like protein